MMTKKAPNEKGAYTIRFGSKKDLAAAQAAHLKIDALSVKKGDRKQSFNAFVVEAVFEHLDKRSKKA